MTTIRMNTFTSFIAAIILLHGTNLNADNTLKPAKCNLYMHDNKCTALCGGHLQDPNYLGLLSVPQNIDSRVQVFDFSTPTHRFPSRIFFQSNKFEKYTQLEKIIMRKSYITHDPDVYPDGFPPRTVYDYLFVNLNKLEYLEFSDSRLDDRYIVALPKSLKVLIMDKNNYTMLDVHWCPILEEISANGNILKNIPILYDPVPPLKKLYLRQNPLDEMTILDLAPLCQLERLELEFLSNSPLTTTNHYCDCLHLQQWMREINIAMTDNIICSKPSGIVECRQFSDLITEAKKLRSKCLGNLEVMKTSKNSSLSTTPTPSSDKKYYFSLSVFLVMLLLISLIAAFYYFKKNEEQTVRHTSMYRPNEEGLEENEEEEFGTA